MRIPAWVQPIGAVPGESAGAEPVLAATPRGLGDRTNGLLGWRALRWGTRHHQTSAVLGDEPVAGAVTVPPIRWTRSPAAQRLWIGIWYSAFDPKGDKPSLTAELQDTAGAALDDPIEWTLDNGYLEVAEDHTAELARAAAAAGGDAAAGAAQLFATTGPPDLFVHTGWSSVPIGTEPRLLDLPASHGQVQLAVSGQQVRIYSVVYAEAFLADLGNASS